MEYYQLLKDLREDHDLTQADVANLLQTTREQMSKYETGKQMMGVDRYMKLAKYYHVSLDYLTGLIDTPRKLHQKIRATSAEAALFLFHENHQQSPTYTPVL